MIVINIIIDLTVSYKSLVTLKNLVLSSHENNLILSSHYYAGTEMILFNTRFENKWFAVPSNQLIDNYKHLPEKFVTYSEIYNAIMRSSKKKILL